MSRDYHATEFIGRLVADPDAKYGETSGTARTRFRVLVNEEWKDRNEQMQKHVESYLVVAFNGLAEACGNYLGRGRRVFVRGRNRTRSYEGEGGKKRWVTEVIAETVQFLDQANAEDKRDRLPACSAAEALDRQEPYINSSIATHALALLARLFRHGRVLYHGGFVNLANGQVTPLSVDSTTWARLRRQAESDRRRFAPKPRAAVAGLTIRKERIPAFREDVCAACAKTSPARILEIDSQLHLADAARVWGEIARFEPFGNENPEPIFATRARVMTPPILTSTAMCRMNVEQDGRIHQVKHFGGGISGTTLAQATE